MAYVIGESQAEFAEQALVKPKGLRQRISEWFESNFGGSLYSSASDLPEFDDDLGRVAEMTATYPPAGITITPKVEGKAGV
jgi:hypothetical protein